MCKNSGFSVLTGLGLELAAEPLRTPALEPKWDPVWHLNLRIFVQRAAKDAKKRGPKMGPKTDRQKNAWKSKTGPLAILHGRVPGPRGGI